MTSSLCSTLCINSDHRIIIAAKTRQAGNILVAPVFPLSNHSDCSRISCCGEQDFLWLAMQLDEHFRFNRGRRNRPAPPRRSHANPRFQICNLAVSQFTLWWHAQIWTAMPHRLNQQATFRITRRDGRSRITPSKQKLTGFQLQIAFAIVESMTFIAILLKQRLDLLFEKSNALGGKLGLLRHFGSGNRLCFHTFGT